MNERGMSGRGASERGTSERGTSEPVESEVTVQRPITEQVTVLRRSWRYIGRKTVREFSKDQCIDSAAALTFYAVLAVFPAILAMISLLNLVGHGASTTAALLDVAAELGPADMVATLREPVAELTRTPAAGWGLVIGFGGALWAASGYVGAFGRAMNHIYEVHEGRPFWRLRPTMLLVTLVAVVLIGLVGLGLVVTGSVARSVGEAIGLESTTVTVWNIAKWPVLLFMIVLVVALLYWATPNVRHPRFRWITAGSVMAILVWVVASLLLTVYVSRIGNYNETYGSLAGVVVFLLWLYVTNLALLLGAEVDAETERGRELQAGIAAEDSLQLPPRDSRTTARRAAKLAADVEFGRSLRERATAKPDAVDVAGPDGAAAPTSLERNRRAWGAGRGSAADVLDRSR